MERTLTMTMITAQKELCVPERCTCIWKDGRIYIHGSLRYTGKNVSVYDRKLIALYCDEKNNITDIETLSVHGVVEGSNQVIFGNEGFYIMHQCENTITHVELCLMTNIYSTDCADSIPFFAGR